MWLLNIKIGAIILIAIPKISIAGQKLANDHRSTGIEYVGIYNSEDLVAKRKHLEQVIADYKPQDWPCPYDVSTGIVVCLDDCVTSYADYAECPERTKFRAERELSLLRLRPIFTHCFLKAEIAAHNHLLSRGINTWSPVWVSFVRQYLWTRSTELQSIEIS